MLMDDKLNNYKFDRNKNIIKQYKTDKKFSPYLDKDNYDIESWNIKSKLQKHAKIAKMGEIVVSSEDKRIIGTTALDTCIGIVLYDRKNKFGMVGHAYSSVKFDILYQMINLIPQNEELEIEYAIVPGYRNVERKDYAEYEELLTALSRICPKNIKLVQFSTDLGIDVCSNTYTYEFAFDVYTGIPVGKYLFYKGENLQNSKYRNQTH